MRIARFVGRSEKIRRDGSQTQRHKDAEEKNPAKVALYCNLRYLCAMRRKIIAFGKYYKDFLSALGEKEVLKVKYVLSLLETEDRMPVKFIKAIRDGLYELRISYNGNIYRIFFIFDEGQIVVLFNGFQKKTQKTPPSEIAKALQIKEEYYEYKRRNADRHQR